MSFSVLSMVLISSCSSDDSSSDSDNGTVLLKKTIATDSDVEKVITIYKYNDNKIVRIIDDLRRI